MHPGAVGGVERNVARAHQRLAVLRLGNRGIGHLEMFGSELAARLFDQQDLAIDGGVHGVLPSARSFVMQLTADEAAHCTLCAALNASRRARFPQPEHSGKRAKCRKLVASPSKSARLWVAGTYGGKKNVQQVYAVH